MSAVPMPRVVEPVGIAWPPDSAVVVLAKTDTDVEAALIRRWAESVGAPVHSSAPAAVAAAGDSAVIVPVRVHWTVELERDPQAGLRSALARIRLPQPGALRDRGQSRALARDPDSARLLIGAPATRAELRTRWTERELDPKALNLDSAAAFAAFVDRQADIVLGMAERRLLGDRFRAPLGIVEELLNNRDFIEHAEKLAGQIGRSPESVLADCKVYLGEMASAERRWAIDVWAAWARSLHSRSYDLDVDREQLARLRELSTRHPMVFLPTHKSNLDPYVMASITYENGLPHNHVLGGINMMFWPLSPLFKRIGAVGIRRSFRDNAVYRFVLARYLGFLAAKRFNLEFYVEGTRSRTGKLLPPMMGLLNYLCDAVEEQGLSDVLLVPTAIVYDLLHEAEETTAESRGAVKQVEGIRWLAHFVKQQRQGHLGEVHVRFGEPINLRAALATYLVGENGVPTDAKQLAARSRLARSKVAFEVCTRINRASMVTAPALVTFALLGAGDRALTLPEVRAVVAPILEFALSRDTLVDGATRELATDVGVLATLTKLVDSDVVECYGGGPETVYRIGPDQELIAAFYRNATVHIFVDRAILELAFLHVSATGGGMIGAWREAMRLRDLLKFEFFFSEKDEFRQELQAELRHIEPDEARWEKLEDIGAQLAERGPLVAQRTLRSFVESYAVVADYLVAAGPVAVDPKAAAQACLGLGKQFHLQRRVTSSEAISMHLFRNGFALAANRGLLGAGAEVLDGRVAFAAQLDDLLARLERINQYELHRVATAREALRSKHLTGNQTETAVATTGAT
jgi:glycerol-3-phosphate O-acyltransferase